MADSIDKFVRSYKPTLGYFQGDEFEATPYANRYLLPSSVSGSNMWGTGGTYQTASWTNDLIGYKIGRNEMKDFIRTHAGQTDAVLFGFLFGKATDTVRTYLCLEATYNYYRLDGQYEYGQIMTRVTKRVYTDNGGQTTMTRTVLNDSVGCSTRMNFAGFYPNNTTLHVIFTYKHATVDNTDLLMIGFAPVMENGDAIFTDNTICVIKVSYLQNQGVDFTKEPKGLPSSKALGKAASRGGYGLKDDRTGKTTIGSFDDTSDKITPSSAPTLSPLTGGFLHLYKVSTTLLEHISDALFYRPTRTIDLIAAVNELTEAFWNNKRIDYILDLLILPLNITAGSLTPILAGGKPLQWVNQSELVVDIEGYEITTPYVDFSCGSLEIPEYWANFLDFSGTRVKLFLPYVGYVDIQPEYINGGELSVDYRFNIIDGSFMCFVRSTSGHSELDESLIGQYAGVAAMHIPLQSQDYSNKISGLISSMGALAAAGMSGNAGAGIGAAANLSNTMIAKPASSSSNGYNASSSYLSHRTPYLIIERQSSQFSEKYPEEVGFPLNVMMTLRDCVGLTKVENAHLDTIAATAEEKELISQYLSEGIII